ncbi:hypothetical protein FACS189473_0200 [Spirochaetia bacterium]|nr:hypothetical protein FACS189473_0200 [Spirochaetia bacterium]
MQRFFKKITIFVLGVFLSAPVLPPSIAAIDTRTKSLEMFLIIDGSQALAKGKDEALTWLCDTVIDGMLQEGDTLTVWLAAGKARQLYSGKLNGADTKETVKALLRAITTADAAADYTGALREAVKADAAVRRQRMTYTLLISGSAAGYDSFPGSTEAAALLRYSRVEEFPLWRAITASLNAGPEIRQAASLFMN